VNLLYRIDQSRHFGSSTRSFSESDCKSSSPRRSLLSGSLGADVVRLRTFELGLQPGFQSFNWVQRDAVEPDALDLAGSGETVES
jgi:hypothetical protein